MSELSELQTRISQIRSNRGFVTDPLKIHLLLTEELGEIARELKRLWSTNYEGLSRDRLGDEIADMFALLSALATEFDIDLETAVISKFFGKDSSRLWKSAAGKTRDAS